MYVRECQCAQVQVNKYENVWGGRGPCKEAGSGLGILK